MLASLRAAALTIVAVLMSAGHAACACLAADASSLSTMSAGAGEHGDHHAGMRHDGGTSAAGHDGAPGAPCEPDDGVCGHCASAAVAKAASAADLMSIGARSAERWAATLQSSLPGVSQFKSLAAAYRLRWAAPPLSSPVSLKIRLRN